MALRDQPPCDCTIGPLTSDQLTAYYAQLGKKESSKTKAVGQGNGLTGYACINYIGFVGKYQWGWAALAQYGYVKKSTGSNIKLRNPNNWKGKNGIGSLEEFLANGPAQEELICEYTKGNYRSLMNNGVLNANSTAEDVAGKLFAAHLLGPGARPNKDNPKGTGIWKWANGGGGADQSGTTASTYYQYGKHAIAVLAPKMPGINAG